MNWLKWQTERATPIESPARHGSTLDRAVEDDLAILFWFMRVAEDVLKPSRMAGI